MTSATTGPGWCVELHALLAELTPGGIAKEINASDVDRFLLEVDPADAIEQTRHDLAVELLADIRRVDEQLKASHKRIRTAVAASGSGPRDHELDGLSAAAALGSSVDVHLRRKQKGPLRMSEKGL